MRRPVAVADTGLEGAVVDDQRLWYVGYGSNLRATRLAAYLRGGRPAGSTRRHAGSRDPRPPAASTTCSLPGRIAFRGEFATWGTGGAAAFWEWPSAGSSRAWGRAYRVGLVQLVDLALQENGLAPADAPPAVVDDVRARLETLVRRPFEREGTATALDVPGSYDLAVRLEATGGEGTPLEVVTLTASPAGRARLGRPPGAYVATILAGLREDVGLSEAEAEAYLRDAGAPEETLAGLPGA